MQLVTFRVEAAGLVPKATFAARSVTGSDAAQAVVERRPVWLPEANALTPCPVYDRDRLAPGDKFTGPAIIEQMDATTFVPDDMKARVDVWQNVILEVG